MKMFYRKLGALFGRATYEYLHMNCNFRNNNYNEINSRSLRKYLSLLATLGYLTYHFNYCNKRKYVFAKEDIKNMSSTAAFSSSEKDTSRPIPPHLTAPKIPERPDLPTYTRSDLLKHRCRNEGVWVTYQSGVYDITEFLDKHPGGDQINLVSGKAVEGFWNYSLVHYAPHVLELMEKYRIGNLRAQDVKRDFIERKIYVNEPTDRHPCLIPLTKEPFNAGVSESLLYTHPITPNEFHFIRTHGPVPEVDLKNYFLEIAIEGQKKSLKLTLEDLKKFPKHSVNATIMCAGNRRDEMMMVKPKKGLRWSLVATGNSIWSGAKLSDILAKAGLTEKDETTYNHVQFDGMDTDFRGDFFSMSIPLWKAVDKRGDVIIAYEMNGAPIPVDHGFPVRSLVPGFAGARSVKWLQKVTVQKEECQTFNHQRLYKGFSPNVYYENLDWNMSPAIDELPVISAICEPVNGGTVKVSNGKINIKGYAFSGGGQKIIRVDVSADQGENWHTAKFTYQTDVKPPRHYSWSLWCCELPAPKGKNCEIWVKAVDSNYNTQPEKFEHIWNLRGVICNAYHKIKVNLS
ncbi:sulfite oxidase, mitochondrial-like isoform X2 [Coccinella septempunctata]|uniref:sulfite oxidase, mitochondrial-like isoform X2 n=1 Tax=Coccinella septempunctata TaxID=41139 RepID=UPI001D062BC5|nr:sulfite oxidase, mitochondrial-like isoform X2 [Coccinella septempunctata]